MPGAHPTAAGRGAERTKRARCGSPRCTGSFDAHDSEREARALRAVVRQVVDDTRDADVALLPRRRQLIGQPHLGAPSRVGKATKTAGDHRCKHCDCMDARSACRVAIGPARGAPRQQQGGGREKRRRREQPARSRWQPRTRLQQHDACCIGEQCGDWALHPRAWQCSWRRLSPSSVAARHRPFGRIKPPRRLHADCRATCVERLPKSCRAGILRKSAGGRRSAPTRGRDLATNGAWVETIRDRRGCTS